MPARRAGISRKPAHGPQVPRLSHKSTASPDALAARPLYDLLTAGLEYQFGSG